MESNIEKHRNSVIAKRTGIYLIFIDVGPGGDFLTLRAEFERLTTVSRVRLRSVSRGHGLKVWFARHI